LVLAFGTTACTDFALYDLDRFWGQVPAFSTMRKHRDYDTYELNRLPAPGSVPVSSPLGDGTPAFSQAALDSAAAALVNPLTPTPEVLAKGKFVYETSCLVCHGEGGKGSGPVVGPGKFPFAPAVNGSTGVMRSEGYIYAIVREGRGLMPPYGERTNEYERWAVATYVHQLAAPAAATPAAMPAAAAPATPPSAAPAPVAPGGTR
jgi:mono/diheme cytochrome c family protein